MALAAPSSSSGRALRLNALSSEASMFPMVLVLFLALPYLISLLRRMINFCIFHCFCMVEIEADRRGFAQSPPFLSFLNDTLAFVRNLFSYFILKSILRLVD